MLDWIYVCFVQTVLLFSSYLQACLYKSTIYIYLSYATKNTHPRAKPTCSKSLVPRSQCEATVCWKTARCPDGPCTVVWMVWGPLGGNTWHRKRIWKITKYPVGFPNPGYGRLPSILLGLKVLFWNCVMFVHVRKREHFIIPTAPNRSSFIAELSFCWYLVDIYNSAIKQPIFSWWASQKLTKK